MQHIFFHPLIAYPDKGFDRKGNAKGQDDYMFTVQKSLTRLCASSYESGFVLIDINSLFRRRV
jgi:hypothetical protein